jgi:DNA-binding beta-propeller fold protein YncE
VLLCALLCVGSLLSAGSALAYSQRTHVFASSFGSAGEALGQLKEPGSVAVSESTGDVYVADRGNDRIDQFGREGKAIAVWGIGVSDGEQEFQVCTSACKAGTGKGHGVAPGAIAVDNSAGPSKGDVYAVIDPRPKHVLLLKLGAGGEKLGVLRQEGGAPWEGGLDGVAVDGSGTVWVYRAVTTEEAVVERFNGATTNGFLGSPLEVALESTELEDRKELEAPFCPKPGFAVDGAGEHVYINHERLNGEGGCPAQALIEEKENKEELKEEPRPVVSAKFKVNTTEEFPFLQGLSAGLDSQDTAAVAVDLASGASTPLGEAANGDVYVANGATVTALDPSGDLVQHIELPGTAPRGGGVALESKTGALYVADSSNRQIDVLKPATSEKPIVDSIHCEGENPSTACAQDLTPTSARLTSRIDPNGAETTFYFQYGTASCVEHESSCTDVPAPPGDSLGSAFGDRTAEVELTGLQADTTYYYRVIAENGHGKVESARTAETFFTTLPTAEGMLPDHRRWEMVSPPKKGGPLALPNVEEPGDIQAAEDGGAISYGTPNSAPSGEPEGNRSKQDTQFLFARGEGEWSTRDLVTPHNKGEGFETGQQQPEYPLFSADLSLGIVEPEAKLAFPLEEPPLSPPLSEGERQEKTIYVRDDPPVLPGSGEKAISEEAAKNSEYLAPGYLPLVTKANDTSGSAFGPSLEFADATADLNHVAFTSSVGLTKNAEGENFGGKGVYEWNATSPQHALQLVSVLPGSGEAPAHEPRLGGLGIARHAISADGSRVVFTGAVSTNIAAELFIRDTATTPAKTIRISVAQGKGVSEPGQAELENEELNAVRFETASSDGSKVFFKDTWPLTEESALHPTEERHPSDLYEFDAETGKLVDLTIAEHPGTGESADVLGTIPGAGEDGSDVYFVANGVLAPGATPGHCAAGASEEAPPGATCNLYVSLPDPEHAGRRKTRLIATLSADDAPDWGAPGVRAQGPLDGSLAFVSSRVSSNGRYLAFMSDRSLTGYDNEDATSKTPGERLDEEVYLYDAQLGRLVCASCNPNRETRPAGIFDNPGAGPGLLVDASKLWQGRWLAGSIPGWTPNLIELSTYQPRYLSDGGRLFFDSADALVENDKNHVEDVYQYESEGMGSCQGRSHCVALISAGSPSEDESAFLDASASGDDVFFLTTEKLLAQDVDTTFDIYDARVCGTPESSACLPQKPPPPLECTGEACKPPAGGQPSFSTPQSATFSGPGNSATSGVLPTKTKAPPKPLTRAQKLAKALKACHKQKRKKKRVACEKRARKQYGAKAKAKKTGKTESSAAGRGRR